ncbi:endonuclease/exonuclease/phosphatase family protein [Gillisia sp. M10.2A]|uniref:Endonuclease/exonuclease/phosphatase family protein n=2 Tax=Gillisia lutea TaxID=2909668 RepID=A0ABS9ECE0_9FLAO|nr:endonuclease/exonuclease/phosphatase family protein [Gillisia lutea]MCF4100517.1 endonuclease/exonuclease/phosphatase family protein [Gillisia lutea]
MISINIAYCQETRNYQINTVAFYNVENLFDTENDPVTFDDDRTPLGKDAWTEDKYEDKLKNIAKVLSEIGQDGSHNSPAIIGICEIENLKVLEDLTNQPSLIKYNYGIVHYDSPDMRGVDVALLYQKSHFKPLNSQSRRLLLYEKEAPSKRVYTRDQLVVTGLLDGEKVHFIVNHWPSRSGGEARSSYKREKAAELNRLIIDSLQQIDPYAKILNMGDFNDDPTNKSIKKVLKTSATKNKTQFKQLYNPMENMIKQGKGTLAYRDKWNLFDQILLTNPLINEKDKGFQFYKAGIFNKEYLITTSGQFRGYPKRSYGYAGYEGGYSDHFPVYVYLIKPVE